MNTEKQGGHARQLSADDEAVLRRLQAASAAMLAHEAALTPAEREAIQAEWAPFRAKVESGAVAVPADQPSPYQQAREAWLRSQEAPPPRQKGRV